MLIQKLINMCCHFKKKKKKIIQEKYSFSLSNNISQKHFRNIYYCHVFSTAKQNKLQNNSQRTRTTNFSTFFKNKRYVITKFMQTTIKSMSFLTQKSIISLHNLQCHPRDKQKTCSNKSMLSQLDLRWLFCFNSWKMVDFFNLLCTRSLKYCSSSIIHYQTISFRTGPLYHVNSNPYPTAIAVGFLCQL